MALQFDIEPVAKQLEQCFETARRQMALAGGDRAIERPAWTARERNDAGGLIGQPFELQPRRFVRRRIEESARIEPHQAAIAFRMRGKEHNARAFRLGVAIARAVIAYRRSRRRARSR